MNAKQAYARRLFRHYMTLLLRQTGNKVDGDITTEVDMIVDLIVDAAVEKIEARLDARLNELHP